MELFLFALYTIAIVIISFILGYKRGGRDWQIYCEEMFLEWKTYCEELSKEYKQFINDVCDYDYFDLSKNSEDNEQ